MLHFYAIWMGGGDKNNNYTRIYRLCVRQMQSATEIKIKTTTRITSV